MKSSVTVKEGIGAGIGFYSAVKGLENQWVVVPIADHIGDNSAIIEIEDRAEVDLVYLNAFIPFEFRYIGQPFLVRLVRMEVAVKEVFSNILRILCPPCSAMVTVQ